MIALYLHCIMSLWCGVKLSAGTPLSLSLRGIVVALIVGLPYCLILKSWVNINGYSTIHGSRDSAVGIATGYGLDD
jgi:hypothetical protein